jgi:hypothetical protein
LKLKILLYVDDECAVCDMNCWRYCSSVAAAAAAAAEAAAAQEQKDNSWNSKNVITYGTRDLGVLESPPLIATAKHFYKNQT